MYNKYRNMSQDFKNYLPFFFFESYVSQIKKDKQKTLWKLEIV